MINVWEGGAIGNIILSSNVYGWDGGRTGGIPVGCG